MRLPKIKSIALPHRSTWRVLPEGYVSPRLAYSSTFIRPISSSGMGSTGSWRGEASRWNSKFAKRNETAWTSQMVPIYSNGRIMREDARHLNILSLSPATVMYRADFINRQAGSKGTCAPCTLDLPLYQTFGSKDSFTVWRGLPGTSKQRENS